MHFLFKMETIISWEIFLLTKYVFFKYEKEFVFLFALICSMSLFTACSDDDDDKIKDPVIGTWKVPAVELDENNSVIGGSVFMTWEAPEDTYLSFLLVSAIPSLVIQMGPVILPQVLQDVTLSADGNIVATYSSAGIDLSGEKPITPVWETSPADYATFKLQGNGKMLLFLNLEKIIADANTKADITTVISQLLELVKNGIPVNYALSNNNEEVKIFIDKELMTTIAAMGPAIAELIPDDPDALGSFGPMIKAILGDLPTAMSKTTKFELGLNLKK